jgi:hypothetical protein
MEEKQAIIGVLMIVAISVASYFVLTSGTSGAATQPYPYITCCCDILATQEPTGIQQILARGQIGAAGPQALFRSQIQTYATSCQEACETNYAGGKVFSEEGRCADNP